jgi:glycerate 2-kinase
MRIKNFEDLAVSRARKIALGIAEAGLEAIDTARAVKKNIRREGDFLLVRDKKFSFQPGSRLVVIGVGKCSLEAAGALEDVLGDEISGGVVIDVHKNGLKRIKSLSGSHPLPTQENVDATKELIAALGGLKENDLVLAIISGGGSTLLCQPKNHTCLEEAKIVECLTRAGANIREINTVRKHTSLARGGYLAQYAYPARLVSLIFSDVPGDELEFVASGPTFRDTTTSKDAEAVLQKYDVLGRCGIKDLELIETPKEEKYFQKTENVLLVSNKIALLAMAEAAEAAGFAPRIVSAAFAGEARELGKKMAEELRAQPPGTALLYGGESTVTVKGKGKGGRNQELALAALDALRNGEIILALASDGRDNSDHAGALGDIITWEKAQHLGLNPNNFLAANDAYNFFAQVGDYLLTGDTGANVSDLILALKSH